MDQLSLAAHPREVTGVRVKHMRREGRLPAVLYGPKRTTTSISIDVRDFLQLYKKAGHSSLVNLTLEGGKPAMVLIHEVQRDPVTHRPVHVDFYEVDMTKKTTAEVELRFVGESKAVKEDGGVLVKALSSVEVECLPQHLVQYIDIDISVLKSFDDVIRVANIPLPEGITITNESEALVSTVQKPRTEEELKALEDQPATADVAAVEKVGEAKEGEAGEAGAAEATPAVEPKKEK
ncbi:MAG: 50S ribosomal protein L25 [Patescibacteria group bacterium]